MAKQIHVRYGSAPRTREMIDAMHLDSVRTIVAAPTAVPTAYPPWGEMAVDPDPHADARTLRRAELDRQTRGVERVDTLRAIDNHSGMDMYTHPPGDDRQRIPPWKAATLYK